ncbi:MAG: 2-phosphosulfolactate phosphatase [Bacillota bacterium]
MKVELLLHIGEVSDERVAGKIAVAIDTLRATSTIITALANGAKEVMPVASIAQAREYNQSTGNTITAGERDGVQISDLEVGNSPVQFANLVLEGQRVILTTTNGTKLLLRLSVAKKVIVAALNNLAAVAREVSSASKLVICCAGTNGKFALEDFLAAGGIISQLNQLEVNLELSDLSLVAYQNYLLNQERLCQVLLRSESGQRLINLGKKEDVNYAAKDNIFAIAPYYRDGQVVI